MAAFDSSANFDQLFVKILTCEVAFQTPSNQRVLVLNNRNVNVNYSITIKDASMQGQHLTLTLEARSFTTIVWNAPN